MDCPLSHYTVTESYILTHKQGRRGEERENGSGEVRGEGERNRVHLAWAVETSKATPSDTRLLTRKYLLILLNLSTPC